jgi:hypothetical protein
MDTYSLGQKAELHQFYISAPFSSQSAMYSPSLRAQVGHNRMTDNTLAATSRGLKGLQTWSSAPSSRPGNQSPYFLQISSKFVAQNGRCRKQPTPDLNTHINKDEPL